MLDLGTLRLGIKVDSDAAKSQLGEVGEAVEETGLRAEDLAAKAKSMIQAFAAAWAVKELVKLGKAALEAYGQFEQLEGGVKKIFGESADQVMQYAQNAYQTAGISANEYMEQVTSFSASLLQALEGDTAEAARIADMAIQDMADNANTFGTDIASIQNAYQGFAKQNYTMLDNLKLGYGGTKEEMERLLEDAEKLSGVEYDIENLDDVYQAIHVIQEEMAITGTTAAESSRTIQGSMASMKASWQNLLVSIGSGEGLSTAVDNFLASLGTVAQNIIPRIVTIVGTVITGLIQALPQLLMSLANAIGNFADHLDTAEGDKFLQAGWNLLKSLVTGLLKAIPELILAVGKLIGTLINKFKEIDLKAIGKAIIQSLLNGLKAAWEGLKNWASEKVGWLTNLFGNAKSAGNAPGHRIGLAEVPYDGYQATLHKGETILTAAEANQFKKLAGIAGTEGSTNNISVNVYGTAQMDVNDLASAVERKLIQMQKRRTLAWQ